ncbi:MAG: hypothetical protein ACLFR8_14455 [Alkalispirochaeta sp.]
MSQHTRSNGPTRTARDVRTADEEATNPGDRITEVLKRFSPAVILIDEWVAYARQETLARLRTVVGRVEST